MTTGRRLAGIVAGYLFAIFVGALTTARHLACYCAVAIVMGVALPILIHGRQSTKLLSVTGLCLGPVAGWLYWRIAGRHAGGPHA